MLYASSGEMRCFECGSIGHVRLSCPHKEGVMNEASPSNDVNGRVEETVGEKVATEDQNVRKEEVSGNIGTESEFRPTTEMLEVVDNVNGEAQIVEEMVVTEMVKETEQVERAEIDEELKLVAADRASLGGIVNLDNKQIGETSIEREEDSEDDALSDVSDVSNLSQMGCDQFYSLEEIDEFLDETFGKVVEVKNYFADTKKFESSVLYWMKRVGEDKLNKRKRFRLKKFVTRIRKGKTPKKRKFL
ncbi:Homeobox goosecoid [Labeo rohita]|uniref:Homeobox goosecoid n=1 Tax=Labeo rohita TaxID=84645 RepID=A0A498NYB5_LABRO|nr:Homeobox goosecoid [Labeo rohita]RXN36659.1 Homeobox goosecoid [Labeo rohita]